LRYWLFTQEYASDARYDAVVSLIVHHNFATNVDTPFYGRTTGDGSEAVSSAPAYF
jgi:hypothetical protein